MSKLEIIKKEEIKIKIPRVNNSFVPVYCPTGDFFPGPDSQNLKAGKWYKEWVPNDHTILKGPDGCWHAFGITHPATHHGNNVHEGEWMSFHAVSPKGELQKNLRSCYWKDYSKILTPQERPAEKKELYAPFIVKRNQLHYMFYGPGEIRLALSQDLYNWNPQGVVFFGGDSARDPYVYYNNDKYYMVYVFEDSIYLRESHDLLNWSNNATEIFHWRRKGVPESPILLKYKDLFYLFWCIYDGENGAYDNRTFVYSSTVLNDFSGSKPITSFKAHAPEIFQDEVGQWYISSVEWPYRGVSITSLKWE